MIEYIVSGTAWSLAGFAAGWCSCSKWVRLERKVEQIEHEVEESRHVRHTSDR